MYSIRIYITNRYKYIHPHIYTPNIYIYIFIYKHVCNYTFRDAFGTANGIPLVAKSIGNYTVYV